MKLPRSLASECSLTFIILVLTEVASAFPTPSRQLLLRQQLRFPHPFLIRPQFSSDFHLQKHLLTDQSSHLPWSNSHLLAEFSGNSNRDIYKTSRKNSYGEYSNDSSSRTFRGSSLPSLLKSLTLDKKSNSKISNTINSDGIKNLSNNLPAVVTSIKDFNESLNDETEKALQMSRLDLNTQVDNDYEKDTVLDTSTSTTLLMSNDSKISSTQEISNQFENIKGREYDDSDVVATTLPPILPPEKPDEKLMKHLESIDVVSSVDIVKYDFDGKENEEAMLLLEAQREADMAHALHQEAEAEAARLEQLLKDMTLEDDKSHDTYIFDDVKLSFMPKSTSNSLGDASTDTADRKLDPLMAIDSPSQPSLNVINDDAYLLSSKIKTLEMELSKALSNMNSALEEKERISAEYSYLVRNYGQHKQQSESTISLLKEKVQEYENTIGELQQNQEYTAARVDVGKLTGNSDAIQEEIMDQNFSKQKELRPQLEEDIKHGNSNLQNMISAKDEELLELDAVIRDLRADIKKEIQLKEEALKDKSDLQEALQRRLSLLQTDNSATSMSYTIIAQAREKKIQKLYTQIERLNNEMKKEIELKNEALRSKESMRSSLIDRINELEQTIVGNQANIVNTLNFNENEESESDARSSSTTAKNDPLQNKELIKISQSIQTLQQPTSNGVIPLNDEKILRMEELIQNLKIDLAREVKTKDDVIKSKVEQELMLKSRIEDLQKAVIDARSNASDIIKAKDDELNKMLNVISFLREKSNGKQLIERSISQISHLDNNNYTAQLEQDATLKSGAESNTVLNKKEIEMQKMADIVLNLKVDLAREIKAKEDIARSKTELESMLQSRIEDLQKTVTDARNSASSAIKSKDEELNLMLNLISTLRTQIEDKLILEKNNTGLVPQLENTNTTKGDADVNLKLNVFPNKENATLDLKIDFAREMKAKDDVMKSKAEIESKLQLKIEELKKAVIIERNNANNIIRAKDNELNQMLITISNLREKIQDENMLKNDILKGRTPQHETNFPLKPSEELKVMTDELSASKTELKEQEMRVKHIDVSLPIMNIIPGENSSIASSEIESLKSSMAQTKTTEGNEVFNINQEKAAESSLPSDFTTKGLTAEEAELAQRAQSEADKDSKIASEPEPIDVVSETKTEMKSELILAKLNDDSNQKRVEVTKQALKKVSLKELLLGMNTQTINEFSVRLKPQAQSETLPPSNQGTQEGIFNNREERDYEDNEASSHDSDKSTILEEQSNLIIANNEKKSLPLKEYLLNLPMEQPFKSERDKRAITSLGGIASTVGNSPEDRDVSKSKNKNDITMLTLNEEVQKSFIDRPQEAGYALLSAGISLSGSRQAKTFANLSNIISNNVPGIVQLLSTEGTHEGGEREMQNAKAHQVIKNVKTKQEAFQQALLSAQFAFKKQSKVFPQEGVQHNLKHEI